MLNRRSWFLPLAALCVTNCLDRSPGEFKAGDLPICSVHGSDADHDGHDALCRDSGDNVHGDDCDDHDAQRYPGHKEVCDPDDRDEDCNPKTFGKRDRDDDGFADAVCCNEDADGKRRCGDDCYDFAAGVHPGAVEVCDRYDNDCDGKTDERVMITRYLDADHDGHGAIDGQRVKICPGDLNGAEKDDDCDDDDALVFPGMPEICDDRDNDCDGETERPGEAHAIVWYLDADHDGFGVTSAALAVSCQPPPFPLLCREGLSPEFCAPDDPARSSVPDTSALLLAFAPRAGDCDDADPDAYPGAEERCDGHDDNCDGRADFGVGVNDFEDDDGDRVADPGCKQAQSDCDDREASANPQREEICDELDNDCDGKFDEQLKSTTYYPDRDGDGYGDTEGDPTEACVPDADRVARAGDCDDRDPERNPDVPEICNTRDDDCDGVSDEDVDACGATLRVNGRVLRSEDDRTVRGARVSVYDAQGALIERVESAASGLFSLSAPAGVVSIAVEPPTGSDLVGIVRQILLPANALVARLDSSAHWNAIATGDGISRDPTRGVFVAEIVGAAPAGGQGVLLGPGGGVSAAHAGSTLMSGPVLPAFVPPLEAQFGQSLAAVTHYNVPTGVHGATLSDVALCQTFLVDNLDTSMPAATRPANLIALPVLENSVTLLRVDCSASLGTCCSAHGERGCSDAAIEACVCAQQPSCCDRSWDAACGNLVTAAACSSCSSVMPKAGACCSAADSPGCANDEVQQCVCQVRPECCTDAWDADCAGAVAALRCGLCPGADIGASSFMSDAGPDAGG